MQACNPKPFFENSRLLASFQPLDCPPILNQCGIEEGCNPYDAIINKIDGGFIKTDWLRHVIYHLINSDSQLALDCNKISDRRGAASDGFVSQNAPKHGNVLWQNYNGTSRDFIKYHVKVLYEQFSKFLNYTSNPLKPNITYKINGANEWLVEVSLGEHNLKYIADLTQKSARLF